MPKIFELFGFPLLVKTKDAESHRKRAQCPFMGCECDGGGNRFASHITLHHHPELKQYFGQKETVPSGICSIQLKEDESPWIVCPRRLLVLGKENAAFEHAHQNAIEKRILNVINFPQKSKIGVWSEVKLRLSETSDEEDETDKTFHYSFDYILMPIGKVSQDEIIQLLGGSWEVWRKIIVKAGYSIARRGQLDFVEDFPIGVPTVIEIMTSSTSGGNKNKRTTIPQSFEDAILGRPHNAPSINKRQVWARMVSQLIVKSEVALHWGGKALWLIQDNLADYISESTALDLRKFVAQNVSEVNILSFGYESLTTNTSGIVELQPQYLFAGPISANESNAKPSFSDLIRTSFTPHLRELIAILAKSKRINELAMR